MKNRIDEIKKYLQQGDYPLMVRRLLDLSLDSKNKAILQRAILISKTYHSTPSITSGDSLIEEIEQLLKNINELEIPTSSKNNKLLEVHEITKQYKNSKFSLQAFTTSLSDGEIVGVVGENGNGKTTFLRSIAHELAINSGEIKYCNLNNPDGYTIKSNIAFIPQRIPKWHGLLKDNLHFSASLSGLVGSENLLMVDFMLERLNLSKYANLNWNQISSGYRTRFEIARVLLQKPKILILDEPLANLDILAQQTILTDLQYLAKSESNSMGIILSSQQLHEVEKIADEILFLKQGKCLYSSKQNNEEKAGQSIIEVETTATKETLILLFKEEDVTIQFNGGFYTLKSSNLQPNIMIQLLINSNIEITYYRDITHSTKRFF